MARYGDSPMAPDAPAEHCHLCGGAYREDPTDLARWQDEVDETMAAATRYAWLQMLARGAGGKDGRPC